MTKNERLIRAMAREGVALEVEEDTYRVRPLDHQEGVWAEVLLPAGFEVEQKAFQQLANFAGVRHPEGPAVLHACATPDIHPGEVVPIGAVITTPANMVIPQAVGGDIACGMRLHVLDITRDQFTEHKAKFLQLLKGDLLLGTRDLPVTPNTMLEMFRNGLPGFLSEVSKNPMGQLATADLDGLAAEMSRVYHEGQYNGVAEAAPHDLLLQDRPVLRDGDMGTVGSGNHFCEIQYVEEVLDRKAAYEMGGIRAGQMTIMIHTGSRQVGGYIGMRWNDRAKALWPKTVKHPSSGIFPIVGEEEVGQYLGAMWAGVNYAFVNRMLLAEMVRQRAKQVFGRNTNMPLVYDLPHNMVFRENGLNVHRKGATPAHPGQPVIIPGSMGDASYLLEGRGSERFQCSCSHGAGRSQTRFSMGRAARQNEDLRLTGVECITLKEERIIEEAPAAYKDIGPVVEVQAKMGMVKPVARLRPVATFKG